MVKQTYTVRKVNSEKQYSPYEFVITRETDTDHEKEQDVIKHMNDLIDFAFEDRDKRLQKQRDVVKKEYDLISKDLAKQIGT